MAEGTVLPISLAGSSAMFKYIEYTYKWTDEIASGGTKTFQANLFKDSAQNTMSTPSGYKVMGVPRFASGTNLCAVTYLNPRATGTSDAMRIKNTNGDATSGHTARIGITYIKTDFIDET